VKVATRDAGVKVASTTDRSHARIHHPSSIDATAARGGLSVVVFFES